MVKAEAKRRITKLRKVINYHNYLYHVLDKPEISDAVFDSLKHELSQLEEQYPDLITLDSPTQRVSGQALDKFNKVRHQVPMFSLDDVFYKEELQDWQGRIQKLTPHQDLDYFTELKIDGLAVALIYRQGVFVQGATRGDGRIGEEVTQNLKTIISIPLRLEIRQKLPKPAIEKKVKALLEKGEIEVRGEVYMTKKAFETVNQERQKNGLSLYANPRNTAAGSIRQLNPKIAASRKLAFLAYDLVTDLDQATHQEEHQIAQALGFRISQSQYCSNLEKVIKFWQRINSVRNKLPYQIDGIVVNVNKNKIFKKLGVVGKAPRGAIAFKFPAKEAATTIEDIIVQVGRTGALTPVAHLSPVRIGGALITRATLHNEDEIRRLGVRIGDTVIVQRAGDVIPDIVKVIKKLRTGQKKVFHMPKQCPVCRWPVIRPKGEVVHRCTNRNCGAQQRERLVHFVSKKGFDIEGLGPKIVNQLMDEELVTNPADFFSLTQGDLVPLERFDEKSADNLIKAIQKSKKIPLDKFIYALGIHHLGEETAVLLSQQVQNSKWPSHPKPTKIQNFNNLITFFQKQSLKDFQDIQDIGPVVGKSIYDWFKDKQNIQLLKRLNQYNIEVEIPKRQAANYKLSGKTFVLTGELESLTRQEAKAKIRELAGDISDSVSSRTDFVIVGKEPGSKYEKAKKLGIKIINEKEFLKVIE